MRSTDRPIILLTGAAGQLGFEPARPLPAQGDVVALDRSMLAPRDPDAFISLVRGVAPPTP